MTPTASKTDAPGSFAPKASPKAVVTLPATNPLSIAICTGSPADTLRVRLLSTAQARHEPAMAIALHGTPTSGRPIQVRQMPPAAISPMPSAMHASKFSRKTNHASNAVSTPSKFNSKEAVEAGVFARPHISKTGPTTPVGGKNAVGRKSHDIDLGAV